MYNQIDLSSAAEYKTPKLLAEFKTHQVKELKAGGFHSGFLEDI